MCGRFALTTTPKELEAAFDLVGVEDFPPRYNIAPTQPVLMVGQGPRRAPGSNLPDRVSMLVRWGLIPAWTKDPAGMPPLFNARSETAAAKPSFKTAMRHRRMLVPASGFYEWRKLPGGRTQPYWVRPREGGVIAFAGLMESFAEPGGSEIDTGAILTTAANSDLAPIHERMPVVIRPPDFERWLDVVGNEPRDVADLLRPVEPGFFEAVPVSNRVNKVAHADPSLQERAEPSEPAPEKEKPRKPSRPMDEAQGSLF